MGLDISTASMWPHALLYLLLPLLAAAEASVDGPYLSPAQSARTTLGFHLGLTPRPRAPRVEQRGGPVHNIDTVYTHWRQRRDEAETGDHSLRVVIVCTTYDP